VAQGSIDAEALRDALESGERITVVDVRKGQEYAEGSIPGSVNFDAYAALNAGDERAMEGLQLPEGTRVVTVCNRGRGAVAAAGARGILSGGRAGGVEETMTRVPGPPTITASGPLGGARHGYCPPMRGLPGQCDPCECLAWTLL
jgi:rhodanese-related sulfurtransferase